MQIFFFSLQKHFHVAAAAVDVLLLSTSEFLLDFLWKPFTNADVIVTFGSC